MIIVRVRSSYGGKYAVILAGRTTRKLRRELRQRGYEYDRSLRAWVKQGLTLRDAMQEAEELVNIAAEHTEEFVQLRYNPYYRYLLEKEREGEKARA